MDEDNRRFVPDEVWERNLTMILSETITIFKSGGEKQLEDRMVRACLNDLDKIRDQINVEVNALPPAKRNMIKKVIDSYLKDLVGDLENGN